MIAQDTHQTVDLETKEGKTFLRKVIRDRNWTLVANRPDFRVRFVREILGRTGEANARVEVTTEFKISKQRKSGEVKAFWDSEPVQVPEATWIHIRDASVFARLYLSGYTNWEIEACGGSTASSKQGLAFLSLRGNFPNTYESVSIGGESVFKNGVQILSGAVDAH